MTRAEAIAIAREAAWSHGRHHSYVPSESSEFTNFVPHEWVVEAILKAVNSQSYGMSTPDIRGYQK